ncbi:META domain-containing protein [Hymenobacter algoricola]|uniref:DUF306 domain-containing protein n=1 Tax=Hymenobacter algoricola TaxID=486267 RepID=A0ABP7MVY3_9BACT
MDFTRFVSLGLLLASGLTTACQTPAPATGATSRPVSPTASATTPPAALRNTRWVLRTLGSQPVAAADAREPYLLLRATEQRAEGHGSCNRFTGPFELPAAGQLRLGPLLATRMACADPGATVTEAGFMRALEAARTYQISGDTLRLYDEAAAQPTAVLHAVYLR